jgi:hypothetical protein
MANEARILHQVIAERSRDFPVETEVIFRRFAHDHPRDSPAAFGTQAVTLEVEAPVKQLPSRRA